MQSSHFAALRLGSHTYMRADESFAKRSLRWLTLSETLKAAKQGGRPIISGFRAHIKGMDATIFGARQYWPVFVLKHQNRTNVQLHLAGCVLMYAMPIIALCSHNWWFLALTPLTQLIGLIGHALFERSPIDLRDAVLTWRAFVGLHVMVACVLRGTYGREICEARKFFLETHERNSEAFEHADPTNTSTCGAQPHA